MLRFLLMGFVFVILSLNQEPNWSADDDTFDPTIHSVVIGTNSWIGDPSPFVHATSKRTGYTYSHTTNYQGMAPSVQLSLMIPLEAGETQPPGGGMMIMDEAQSKIFIEAIRKAVEAKADDKFEAVPVKTSMESFQWTLRLKIEGDQKVIELVEKQEQAEHDYQFTVNASRKLIGALEHSLKELSKDDKEPSQDKMPN